MFWSKNLSFLFQLFDWQKNPVYIKQLYLFFFQNRYRCGLRFFPFPYIICTLYYLYFSYFRKRSQNILSTIFVSTLSFVDESLFISQEKYYKKSNTNLFCSYSVISSLFKQFGLTIECNKLEVFHFSKTTKNFDPLPLDLELLERPILQPKDKWRYLRFIFDIKLSFHQHIHFYSNKALSTIKSMKMLGNFTRRLLPLYKQLLYRTCIMPIVFYGFQLWYYKMVPLSCSLKELKKIQHRAVL